MSSIFTPEFIKEIPKTDLHLHLDGSIRIPTLIELAKENSVPLPSYTEEGLKELVFKERYSDLGDYLHGFQYTVSVLQSPEALERCSYELACDNFTEGVRYIEVRFAPQLHARPGFDLKAVLRHVNNGLEKAKQSFNKFPAIAEGKEPPFSYGIIACAMRKFGKSFSEYYRRFVEMYPYTSKDELYRRGSMALAEACIAIKKEEGIPIVAFDLAGQEDGFPAGNHAGAFQYTHKNFLYKTVHAGEAYGPESIFQAITELHADRIGHCYHLFSEDRIQDKSIEDKAAYIEQLAQFIADRRITIEVCLTSNLQTMPELASMKDHAFAKMLEAKLSVTLCTDNRTISNTSVSKEIELAVENFDISSKGLKNIITYGFKRSFFDGSYLEKRAYVRKMIDYYEMLEKKHNISKTTTS